MMKSQTRKSIPARRSPGHTSSAPDVCVRGTGGKSTTGEKTHLRARDKLVIGTWNVETLWRDGRLEELCHELKHYKWNVIGLSEVRKKALGEVISDEGHKLFYCGRDDRHVLVHGVGFLVHKDTAKSILGCNFISSRLISKALKHLLLISH